MCMCLPLNYPQAFAQKRARAIGKLLLLRFQIRSMLTGKTRRPLHPLCLTFVTDRIVRKDYTIVAYGPSCGEKSQQRLFLNIGYLTMHL